MCVRVCVFVWKCIISARTVKGIFSAATKQVYASVGIDRDCVSADSVLLPMPGLKIEMEVE